MQITRIPFAEVPQFSKRDIAYATLDPSLAPFYKYAPKLEAFADVITDKAKDNIDRPLLVKALKDQYANLASNVISEGQIELLAKANTYTVITAHQPSLFTGPLYFVIKILSTINLVRQLAEAYPEQNFVPFFITGGEDHDFEEINHTHLFGQTIEWQNDESGAVGSMSTASLGNTLAQLKDILGNSDDAQTLYEKVARHYKEKEYYGMATISFVHALFAEYGLLVFSMNNPDLKARFLPIMKEELLQQSSRSYVEQTQQELEKIGFSGQAHAREINLFYLQAGMRARIEQSGGHYQVVNTDIKFSEAELLQELASHPERFSPNVIMRPLFQEYIFPNLAYIGGGGELAYWLERKSQFAHFGINFPMLIRRNSLLWIDSTAQKRMTKLGLNFKDLFQDTHTLIRQIVNEQSDNELSLAAEKKSLEQVFEQIAEQANRIDPSLKKAVLAESARSLKSVENLEGRLMRAEKQKHENSINQLKSVKDKLFPGNGLQERHDNFLNFYLRYGETFFETLLSALDPLTEGMVVVSDN